MSYNGPAPVSRYLRPRPAPPSSVSLPSSSTTVATSSMTSIMSGGVTSLPTISSTTSVGSLSGESKCQENEPLANARPPSIEMITQVERLTVAEITEDTAVEMEMDSETQPASDTVPRDDLAGSTVCIPASRNIERFVAAFRGRQMYGQGVEIPEGYGGLVLRTPPNSKGKEKDNATPPLKPLSEKPKPKSRTRVATRRKRAIEDEGAEQREGREDEDCGPDADMEFRPPTRRLIPSSKFTSFTLWTPNRPLDEGRDEYARALIEWTRLASEIHSHSLSFLVFDVPSASGMFSLLTPLFTLVAAAAVCVRADPNPNTPGPGDVFIQGQPCIVGWDVDPTGLWQSMNIDLMTGDNFNMVFLTTVATVDGTDPGKNTISYPCPQVVPHSPIYFYQFSSPHASNKTWTTRFTITDSTKKVVTPSNPTQQDGQQIPWGTGLLVNGSDSFAAPSASGGSFGLTGTGGIMDAPPNSSMATTTTGSPYPLSLNTSAPSAISDMSATSSSDSFTGANRAAATLSVSNSWFHTWLVLWFSASTFAVMF
ncbi:ribonuclease H2 non-catalytic subunit-domain-containing protein [Chiua virens]|nr:ribonuclease H2 non-catalytic subunit-domain-containing protein [Chiua virens]